jgi:hypothetical protein
MNYNNESGLPNPDLRAVKATAKKLYGNLEGVEGIGIGDRALRIYVRTEEVAKNLPKEIQGVEVVYIVTGQISAYGGDSDEI